MNFVYFGMRHIEVSKCYSNQSQSILKIDLGNSMSKKARTSEIVSPTCDTSTPSLDEWISLNRNNYTSNIHTLVLAAKYNDIEVNNR